MVVEDMVIVVFFQHLNWWDCDRWISIFMHLHVEGASGGNFQIQTSLKKRNPNHRDPDRVEII